MNNFLTLEEELKFIELGYEKDIDRHNYVRFIIPNTCVYNWGNDKGIDLELNNYKLIVWKNQESGEWMDTFDLSEEELLIVYNIAKRLKLDLLIKVEEDE